MRQFLILAGFAIAISPLAVSTASASGNEVVVIYNSRLPESKELADYYASRREIPRAQIFGFDLTTNEIMSRAEYRDTLEKPLLEKLEENKLWKFGSQTVTGTNGKPVTVEGVVTESEIRYAVICYGVPLKILNDEGLRETGEETLRTEFRRNDASVDSELACLPIIRLRHLLAGPLRNVHYGDTNATAMHPTNGLLMVARLDGPTPQIARGLVDKALEAEHYGMWGRAYFDLRGTTEAGLKTGDDWIRSASEICRTLGFETTVDTNAATFPASFPMSQIAFYCGWYDNDVSGPFAEQTVEFMPGAFAYHLHSFSAVTIRSADKNWVGPLLSKGATITMGSVNEPYLGGTPDVGIFSSRLIFYGFTFGQAAYASQNSLSWQTTVVGDPLYCPFRRPAQILHMELERNHDKRVEWSYLRVADLNLVKNFPIDKVIASLEQTPLTKQSAVLSEKLGDLCTAQGKPSSAIYAYEQALKLEPSPQQRIRLRLTLGERLATSGKSEEAYKNYQDLLEEIPRYPGRVSVYEKLAVLARKLGKNGEAARWEEQVRRASPVASTPAASQPVAPKPIQPIRPTSPITPPFSPQRPPTTW